MALQVNHVSTEWIKLEPVIHGEIPLSVFDRVQADLHIAVLLVYNTPTASNTKIKHCLSKALHFYPKLAGKISLRPFPAVILNEHSGVLVSEATVEQNLAEFLPLPPCPELTQFHHESTNASPLVMIQLTRFHCGGLIIGFSSNHMVADAQSISNFLVTWSQLVCERELHPFPIHDREFLIRPRKPPAPEFPHEYIKCTASPPPPVADELCGAVVDDDVDIENVLVPYPYDFICKLQEKTGFKRSTFECLLAHLWKKITIARRLGDDEISSVRVAVNGRQRMGLAPEFFGNLVLHATPTAKAKVIKQSDEEYIANLISAAIHRIGSNYFQSFVDFGELNKQKYLFHSWNEAQGNGLRPDLEVNSWLGFQFSEIKMGAGGRPPYAFLPSWIPMEGIVVLASPPEPSEDQSSNKANRWSSGINAIVPLFLEDAEIFKKIAYSLD